LSDPLSSPSAPALPPGRERLLLFFLVAVQFANIVDFMILMPLGPRLMDSFQIPAGKFGALVSAYTFSAGAFGLLVAPLLDRFARKTAMLWGMFGFIAGTLFCGFAPSYSALLAARMVAGAFGGLISSVAIAMIADAVPVQRRGAAMGKMMTSFALASIAGVPLGIYAANHLGWHAPFRILGAVAACVWIAAFYGLPSLPRAGRNPEGVWRGIAEIFAHRRHWLAFSFTTAMMFAGFVVIPYISAAFVQNGGLLNEELPYIYLAGGLCTFFSMPLIGRLADKYGLYRIFAVMSLCTIAPMLLVTHSGHMALWQAIGLTVFFMVCASGRFAPGITLVTTAVDPRHRAGFLSVNTACQQIASGFAAMTAAFLLTSAPDGRILGYGAVGWLGVAGLLLSVFLGSRIRPAT
jgi:predicted MFS family arabinose efflux permease